MTEPTDFRPRTSTHPKRSGVLRGLFALRYSYSGIVAALRSESAFRQEVAGALIAIPLAVLLPVQPVERAALIASVLLVLLVELLNSAIEAIVDRISPDLHELSGRAKDCGSAAVMIALVICALTWGLICWPLLLRWLATSR